jgi:hypothetical protein
MSTPGENNPLASGKFQLIGGQFSGGGDQGLRYIERVLSSGPVDLVEREPGLDECPLRWRAILDVQMRDWCGLAEWPGSKRAVSAA